MKAIDNFAVGAIIQQSRFDRVRCLTDTRATQCVTIDHPPAGGRRRGQGCHRRDEVPNLAAVMAIVTFKGKGLTR
jgi:hypothetical protein